MNNIQIPMEICTTGGAAMKHCLYADVQSKQRQ